MKRGLFILTICILCILTTGCKKETTTQTNYIEQSSELLSVVTDGALSGNKEKVLSTFPDAMKKTLNKVITEQNLNTNTNNLKKKYGNDVTVSYEVKSLEYQNNEDTNHLNKVYSYVYYKDLKISECYKIVGNITYSGSKKETTESIEDTYYCNFDGEWKLLMTI